MNPQNTSLKVGNRTLKNVTSHGEFIFLDGLRGLAAFYVMVHHARMLLWEGYSNGFNLHAESYSLLSKLFVYFFSIFRYGYEAVLFFFILSGFVIHLRYARNLAFKGAMAEFDFIPYLKRRARRLYPPLITALALTLILDSLGKGLHFPIYYQETPYSLINESINSRLDIITLLGNLIFLMKTYVSVYGSNGPLWSLKFEWWFYVIYPLFWFASRRSLTLATILMIALFLVSSHQDFWPLQLLRDIFSTMLIWWLGVILADIHAGRIRCGWIIIALVNFILAIFVKVVSPAYSSLGIGLGFASLLSILFELHRRNFSLNWLERLKPLGDMSYTVYVIHFPLFVFISGWLMSRSGSGVLPQHFLWVFIGLTLTLLFSYATHRLVERPFITRLRTQG